MDISNIASLDFETGSYVDLRKTGAARYAEDVTTRMICMAAQIPGAHMSNDYRSGPSQMLVDWVGDGGMVSAWNAMFEYWIWNVVLPRQFPNRTLPKLKVEQLVDTMVVAGYWGLPLKLDTAAQALPQLGIQKDADGHRLMMQMNKPRNRKTGEWWHETDPAKLDRLTEYCRTDVDVERTILGHLPSPQGFDWGLPALERRVFEMDANISTRGVLLDRDLVTKMKTIAEVETERLNETMDVVTGGEVRKTTSAAALINWVSAELGETVKSLAKDKLANMLKRTDLPGDVRAALEIRQEAAKSSVAKLTAMEAMVCLDGRIRGLTQYYGAFRTGRWAGRGIQVQNFPRSMVYDQDGLVDYILGDGDADGFEMFFGVTAMSGLSSALRGCLTVPGDKVFGAVDFSQIEARVLPWLAGAGWKLDIFVSGKDLYKVEGAGIHRIREEDVTPAIRQEGKVATLALGYAGGVGAFHSMAAVYGLEITDARADEIKVAWREANPEIVKLWRQMEDAARNAIRNPGQRFGAGTKVYFRVWNDMLLMVLPSGRFITMREPQLLEPDEDWMGDQISFMDLDQYTRQWKRVTTYGGQLTAYATQGSARDLMAHALLGSHDAGFAALATVHDEGLYELDAAGDFEGLERLFKAGPTWAKGLPLDADGYVSDRFKKG